MAEGPAAGTHAALMDQVYRRQRYIYDLTRKYYLFGRDRLIREAALRPGQSAVEVGCGTARNLIQIARLYPGVELFGLDASSAMLSTAADSIARAGLSARIHLVQGYAEALTPGLFGRSEPFDHVLFPYSLSMIPDWRQALTAASAALRDDGRIHVVDFGDLTGLGPLAAAMLRGWLRLFHVEPRVEILHELEIKAQQQSLKSGQLSLLPARYAFLWNCSKAGAEDFASLDVAARSQAGRNLNNFVQATAAPVDIRAPYPPR
ncbi:MAG: class I SAM-dependent methyltransferase [Rhizomicrobium sp.]